MITTLREQSTTVYCTHPLSFCFTIFRRLNAVTCPVNITIISSVRLVRVLCGDVMFRVFWNKLYRIALLHIYIDGSTYVYVPCGFPGTLRNPTVIHCMPQNVAYPTSYCSPNLEHNSTHVRLLYLYACAGAHVLRWEGDVAVSQYIAPISIHGASQYIAYPCICLVPSHYHLTPWFWRYLILSP
jgi:hypothetical protein